MDLAEHIETGNEFLLAYATQGRPADSETGPGSHPRHAPEGMLEALVQLSDLLINRPEPIERLIAEDCQKVGVAIAVFLRQEQIVSETVYNQNASIHLRGVLAGLFLYV